jgi:hypothetical protein
MNHFLKALNAVIAQAPEAKTKRKQAKEDVHPEPGEWVYDMPKGMKPINRPEPLPDGLIDCREIEHQISYNGLGHCIWSLIPEDRIQDQILRRKWDTARRAMESVLYHLENF